MTLRDIQWVYSKQKSFTQCCIDVGPASQHCGRALKQHCVDVAGLLGQLNCSRKSCINKYVLFSKVDIWLYLSSMNFIIGIVLRLLFKIHTSLLCGVNI